MERRIFNSRRYEGFVHGPVPPTGEDMADEARRTPVMDGVWPLPAVGAVPDRDGVVWIADSVLGAWQSELVDMLSEPPAVKAPDPSAFPDTLSYTEALERLCSKKRSVLGRTAPSFAEFRDALLSGGFWDDRIFCFGGRVWYSPL